MRIPSCIILLCTVSAVELPASVTAAKEAITALARTNKFPAIYPAREHESTLGFVRTHVRAAMRRARIKPDQINTEDACKGLQGLAKASSELHYGPDERDALGKSQKALRDLVNYMFEKDVTCTLTSEMQLVIDHMKRTFAVMKGNSPGDLRYFLVATGLLYHNSLVVTAGMARWLPLGVEPQGKKMLITALRFIEAAVQGEKEKRNLMQSIPRTLNGDCQREIIENRKEFVKFMIKAHNCAGQAGVCKELNILLDTELEQQHIIDALTK